MATASPKKKKKKITTEEGLHDTSYILLYATKGVTDTKRKKRGDNYSVFSPHTHTTRGRSKKLKSWNNKYGD